LHLSHEDATLKRRGDRVTNVTNALNFSFHSYGDQTRLLYGGSCDEEPPAGAENQALYNGGYGHRLHIFKSPSDRGTIL